MSYWDDHEHIMYGGRRREDDDDEEPVREPKCRRCGSTEVRWRHQGGKWVLFSLQPGVIHACKADLSDFEPVQPPTKED